MADETTQKAAHEFFASRLQTLEPFTKEDLKRVTGWSDKTLNTYWSKQFKGILEPLDESQFRVRERFRAYLDWKRFKDLVSQVRTVKPIYAPIEFGEIIIYEFYIPLTHENALKRTLDSLFYEDVIIPRLRRIGIPKLRAFFQSDPDDPDDIVVRRACAFVEEKFAGYSTYHVDGRFRVGPLATQQQAADLQKAGKQYLVDETTAVTRFIFPCRAGEADMVRFLFRELFTNSITEQVSGEDEIWVSESGLRDCVQIWKPSG